MVTELSQLYSIADHAIEYLAIISRFCTLSHSMVRMILYFIQLVLTPVWSRRGSTVPQGADIETDAGTQNVKEKTGFMS